MKKKYAVYVADPAGWDEEGPYSYKETFFGDDADAGEYVASDILSDVDIGSYGAVVVTGYRAAIALRNRLNQADDWVKFDSDGDDFSFAPHPVYAVCEFKQKAALHA